jgi:putative spermidine/putrescine transport system substrate-binding protein
MSHLTLEEVTRMRITAEKHTRRAVLLGGVKACAGLAAVNSAGVFLAACGDDEAGAAGTIQEIGLSLTEDPRILKPFEEKSGIRVEGKSEGLGNLITFWKQNYEQFDVNQTNFNQLGAIRDTLRTVPTSDVPAWNEKVTPLFRKPGESGYNEKSGWPIAGIYTEKAVADKTYDEMQAPPTWYGFDAFGYLKGKADGDLESYGAIFDEANKGRATLLDEPITTVMKVATFLAGTGQASFDGAINNLTKDDLKICFDFLDEQKSKGQFRLFWSDFGQLVDLLAAGELYVGDFWASACAAAAAAGAPAVFVNDPKEGSNGWIHGQAVSKATDAYPQIKKFINWSLESGVLGRVLGLQGYYSPRPDKVRPLLEKSHETNKKYNDWEYWYEGAVPSERPSQEERLKHVADWQAYPDEFQEYSRLWTEFTAA